MKQLLKGRNKDETETTTSKFVKENRKSDKKFMGKPNNKEM